MEKFWNAFMARPIIVLLVGLLVGVGVGTAGSSSNGGDRSAVSTADDPGPTPTVTVTATATTTETAMAPTPEVTITKTVKRTPPPPPGYSTLIKFKGRNDRKTDPFDIPSSATRWRVCYDFKGDDHAAVWLLDGETGDEIELLLNDIGAFEDCTVIYEPTGFSYALDVSGSNWVIKIQTTSD